LCVAPVAARWPSPRRRLPPVSMQKLRLPVELPSPEPASSRFILPWRPSSSEFLRSHRPPAVFRRGLTYPGSRPSSRHHSERVHFSRRLPSLRSVPSSGFRNLSTVFSALRLRGLLSSRSHVQGCRRSGASLPAQPCSLIRNPFPLAVVLPAARRSFCRLSAFASHRPDRVPHPRSLGFEALLHARPRCLRFGYSPRRSPLPSSVFSPPGPRPPPRPQFPQSHPLSTIPPETLRLGVFYAPLRSAPFGRPQRFSAAG
jgi:hypothetical protein